jgi:hypothetical protein
MQTTAQTEKWVSKSEACRECGISIVKLRNIIAKHQLVERQSTRDNRKILVNVYEVQRYLGPD